MSPKKIRAGKIVWFEILLIVCFFVFSFWLMFHTFTYKQDSGEMILASRVWSDFGAHIPLIRSFSYGSNWPPEYPLFPGEKIRYHFLFYASAGLLEKIGLRIDWALNIPSALGFFSLLFMIYTFTRLIFKRRSTALLAVLLFLFNGTFSFINYFKKFPVFIDALNAIPQIKDFPSFGPWDGNLVTAFNNLNIYTNQRHLAPSFAIVFVVLYLLLKINNSYTTLLKQKGQENLTSVKDRIKYYVLPIFSVHQLTHGMYIGIFLSTLLFLNQAALLPAVILVAGFFLFNPPSRYMLFIGMFCSIPFIVLFTQIATVTGTPTFEPGYLSQKPFAFVPFALFWLHNLGLHIMFIPLGLLMAPKQFRWLVVPLLVIFALPNMYRFSPDMINNHKLFNLFMIFGVMYTAHALTSITVFLSRKKLAFLSIVWLPPVLLLLTFSGVLDFMVIKNDYPLFLKDIPLNKDAAFIHAVTPPDAVILNSTWFYHPASLGGRKIYNGYSFFTWSAGYDTYARERIVKEIYHSEDMTKICTLLAQEHISHVELNKSPEEFLRPISVLWQTMTPNIYENIDSGVTLFSVKDICQ